MSKVFVVGILLLFCLGFVVAGNETMIGHIGDNEATIGTLSDGLLAFAGDFIPPRVSINSPSSGVRYETSNIFFNITTDENSSCKYSLDNGKTNFSLNPNANNQNFIAVKKLGNGEYLANIYCNDIFGNPNGSLNVPFSVAVASSGGGLSGGGGGGGGGGDIPPIPKNAKLVVDSHKFSIRSVIGDRSIREFNIRNTGDAGASVRLRVEGQNITIKNGTILSFDKFVGLSLNNSKIEKGKSIKVVAHILAPDILGVFVGKIIIDSGKSKITIPIIINTQSKETIFDVAATVINNKIYNDEKVRTQIDLLPVGEKGIDITLKYKIKDFSGKVYSEKSETFYVRGPMSFVRAFPTKNLPPNHYVVAVQMIYLGGFASASSQFEVVGKSADYGWTSHKWIYFSIISFVISASVFFGMRLRKMREYKKE